jgi:hypothetical protein
MVAPRRATFRHVTVTNVCSINLGARPLAGKRPRKNPPGVAFIPPL